MITYSAVVDIISGYWDTGIIDCPDFSNWNLKGEFKDKTVQIKIGPTKTTQYTMNHKDKRITTISIRSIYETESGANTYRDMVHDALYGYTGTNEWFHEIATVGKPLQKMYSYTTEYSYKNYEV